MAALFACAFLRDSASASVRASVYESGEVRSYETVWHFRAALSPCSHWTTPTTKTTITLSSWLPKRTATTLQRNTYMKYMNMNMRTFN